MKKILRSIMSLVILISIFLTQKVAYAASLCPPGGGFDKLCDLKAEKAGGIVGSIISILFILAIILALIYLVYGGIRYITSGGDKGKVDAARSHITAAIIGLILSLLAYFIVNLVTYVLTGETFTDGLEIPTLLSE